MKRMILVLAALALCAPAALAVTRGEAEAIARDATGGADVVRAERDDGVYEVELRGGDARYQVEILDATGAVLEVETSYPSASWGASFELSADDARVAAAKVAPEAADGFAIAGRGDDGSVYEVFYSAEGAVGEITVNAQTGAITRVERYPEAAARGVLSADEVARLVSERQRGAEIVELELEWDDGRYLYEGEATAGGARYSFELDAETGRFIEFGRDD